MADVGDVRATRDMFVGGGLVVRESQRSASAAGGGFDGASGVLSQRHLVFTPDDVYGRLARADVAWLHEALGEWLAR